MVVGVSEVLLEVLEKGQELVLLGAVAARGVEDSRAVRVPRKCRFFIVWITVSLAN